MPVAYYYTIASQTLYNNKYKKRSDKNDASYMREDLWNMLPIYQKIRDCLGGQEVIKSKKLQYLPKPNAADNSPDADKRYEVYLQKAIFCNFIGQTIAGLEGQCYIYNPDTNTPDILQKTKDCIDGESNLIQFSKKTLNTMISFSRGGLFTDFPVSIGREITLADQKNGIVKPTTVLYEPEQIISHDFYEKFGNRKLSYVSLFEIYNATPEYFKPTLEERIRVLRMKNDVLQIEIHKKDKSGNFVLSGNPIIPKVNGVPYSSIEDVFTFLGCSENSAKIQMPQTSAICDLNLGHYINYADYESSCAANGQPTLILNGLTQQWYDKNFKDGVKTGAGAVIQLGVGGDGKYLQVAPNTMPFEAMKHKESQMISLGAKMVQPSSVVKTATESTMDKSEESSLLTSTSSNCSDAIEKHLKLSYYMLTGNKNNDEYNNIKFKIRTESALMNLTSVEQTALIASWMAGAISDDEMREQFYRAGIAFDRKFKPKKEKPETGMKSKKTPGKDANGTVNTTTGKGFVGNKV